MKKIALIMFITVSFLFICSCTMENEYQQSRVMMDTLVTITLYAPDKQTADIAFDEAFSEIERIEKKFSIYQDSVAQELNTKGIVENDTEFIKILEQSKHYSILTNGSFDITVQPILKLYTESFEIKNRPPTAQEINSTLKLVNYKALQVNENNATLNKSFEVTFGGIVKGYAIDMAANALKDQNIKSALINAGGDMFGYGTKRDKTPWRIAIQNPDENNYLMDVSLTDKAIATSGNYERYFNENKSFHHIVDPRTGYSANSCISVTIIAGSAAEADALATGIFVMGPKKGKEIIERLNDTEALIIDSNRTLHYSNGFPNN